MPKNNWLQGFIKGEQQFLQNNKFINNIPKIFYQLRGK